MISSSGDKHVGRSKSFKWLSKKPVSNLTKFARKQGRFSISSEREVSLFRDASDFWHNSSYSIYDPTVLVVSEASLKLIEDIAEIVGIYGVYFWRWSSEECYKYRGLYQIYNGLSQWRSILHLCSGWQHCAKLKIASRQKGEDTYLDGLPLHLMTHIRVYRK